MNSIGNRPSGNFLKFFYKVELQVLAMPGRMGIMGEKFKTFISCTKEDNLKLLAFVIVLLAIIAFFGW